jgi:hypothetical protein
MVLGLILLVLATTAIVRHSKTTGRNRTLAPSSPPSTEVLSMPPGPSASAHGYPAF